MVGLLLSAPTLVVSQTRNHSFDVQGASATVCADGATFNGQAIAGSALNIPLTSEVYDAAGTTLLFTGDTNTFTMLNVPHTFTVLGSLTVGSTVTLSVTDVPGMVFGNEGDGDTATVADCSLVVCGDGNVDPGETCDPADPGAPAGCRPASDPERCTSCGDGSQQASEACDDGNTVSNDGCSAMCMVEAPTMGQWGGIVLGLALLAAALLAGGGRSPLRRRVLVLLVALFGVAAAASAQPTFSKVFTPDTIGPGSTSMLIFTIDNSEKPAVTDLAFTDVLPAGVTLAAPAFVSNTCPLDAGGSLSAPNGGTTVTLTGGQLGAGQTCQIVVNVTAGAVDMSDTTYMNVSGDLTSSAGNSGTASDDLMVDIDLPGFSKSFAPSSVAFGGRTTLTLLIDNTANASNVTNLDFTDNLPPGMVIANPANKSTNCGTATIPPTLTAMPGSASIVLDADGTGGFPAVASGATCTVIVDVIGGAVGTLGNVSSNLQATFVDAGKAAAVLTVTGGLLTLEKEFTDDPVVPGGTVTLEFTVRNNSRVDSATAITFDDTLDPLGALTGLAPSGALPMDPCGTGSSLGFAGGVLTLTGGVLPPEGSCTFSVALSVPAAALPGTYSNTSGAVSGDVGGEPETGNTAGDLLFVNVFPILTKEFTDGPVGAGGSVTLEFTITNPGASAMTDIEFVDELTDNGGSQAGSIGNGFLPFPVSVTLPPVPNPPCGGGSSLALVSLGTDRQGLELLGGSLAAAGMAGDSCTFEVTVDIPAGLAPGTYTNTTEETTGTVDGATATGPPATDDIVVVAAPQISKEFTDDPAVPGGTVTLEFTLQNLDPDNAASDIAFSDDLGATLTGLTLTSVLLNDCGGTVSGVGTDMFGYSGGSLAADATCTIRVSLTMPGSPRGGTFPNTTSDPTATVATVAASSAAASDDLVIAGLQLSKAFTDDPVIAGGTARLVFTLTNLGTGAADDATAISFSDDLAAMLPGTPDITATKPPSVNTCGGTDTFPSSTFLLYSGGSLGFGSTCTIEYDLTVPAGVDDDDYLNVTGSLTATIDGSAVSLPAAEDVLTIQSNVLALDKEFTDDPVNPGDTVTLKFTLENLSLAMVTDIAFEDDLDATLSGLAAIGATTNTCGGMAAGFPAGLFQYSGGSLGAGATCMIVLTVDVPAGPLPGNVFPNTTTGVDGMVGALDVFGDPASDDLLVDTLTLGKAFDGPTTATGTAKLTFTITNLDAVNAVNGLAFSDNLNSTIAGLTATLPPSPNPPCGAGSALSGTSFLSLTGGNLPAGGSCSFEVTVTVPGSATAGNKVNTTSQLFDSGLPVAPPATATLKIEPRPTFAKVFAPDTIAIGGVSTLTFTIDNTASALAASGLDFTDNLPAGVVVATPPSASTTCSGGTLTAVAGSGVISYSGGSVAAGASCTVVVNVTSAAQGDHVNTSGDLTSSSGNSGTASDTLTVSLPPTFAKVFAPDAIAVGGVSTLTFTIDNSASGLAASGLDFTDNLPASVVVATPAGASTTCSGGTLTALAGSGVISYTGGSVAAGASCTVVVDVTSATPGPHVNTSGNLTSSSGNSGPASDTLTVQTPPTFTKAFAPNPVGEAFDTTLTFTIDNSANVIAASSLTFSDMLPFDLLVAAVPAAVNNCGGSFVANPGSTTVSLTGGTVGAGVSCTISVQVNAPSPGGPFVNTTGDLTSTLGNSGKASDTLFVNQCMAADGVDKSLSGLVLGTTTVVVCRTIKLGPHLKVDGPNGNLTLKAGVSVIFFDGVEFDTGSTVTITIDPSLIP